VTTANGEEASARKLLIATGVVDNLPSIEGFRELYGRSVFHCPYCDGWELRDQPIAIYGRGPRGLGLALELTTWSRDLVLCTDGPSEIDDDGRASLDRNGIGIREERVARLEGTNVISAAARCSSPPASRSVRASRINSAASSTTREPFVRGSTRRPTSPAFTSRGMRRGPCSGSSSPRPRAPKRRLPSTPT
jgi:hypothetical protein